MEQGQNADSEIENTHEKQEEIDIPCVICCNALRLPRQGHAAVLGGGVKTPTDKTESVVSNITAGQGSKSSDRNIRKRRRY